MTEQEEFEFRLRFEGEQKPEQNIGQKAWGALDAYGKAGMSNLAGTANGMTAGMARPAIKAVTGQDIGEGSFLGRMGGAMIPAGMAGKMIGGAMKGAPALARGAAQLGGEGAVYGLGLSPEEDFKSYLQNAPKDVAWGGATNILAGGALRGIGNLINKAKLSKFDTKMTDAFSEGAEQMNSRVGEIRQNELPSLNRNIDNLKTDQSHYESVAKDAEKFKIAAVKGKYSKDQFQFNQELARKSEELSKSKDGLKTSSKADIEVWGKKTAEEVVVPRADKVRTYFWGEKGTVTDDFGKEIVLRKINTKPVNGLEIYQKTARDSGLIDEQGKVILQRAMSSEEKALLSKMDELNELANPNISETKIIDPIMGAGIRTSKPNVPQTTAGDVFEFSKSIMSGKNSQASVGQRVSYILQRNLAEAVPEIATLKGDFIRRYRDLAAMAEKIDPFDWKTGELDIEKPFKFFMKKAKEGFGPQEAKLEEALRRIINKYDPDFFKGIDDSRSALSKIKASHDEARAALAQAEADLAKSKVLSNRSSKLSLESEIENVVSKIARNVNDRAYETSKKLKPLTEKIGALTSEKEAKEAFVRFARGLDGKKESLSTRAAKGIAKRIGRKVISIGTNGVL